MIRNLGLKALAGAVALALGGNALANTTFNPASADGHLFLNVVDNTKNTSYVYDTGITASSVIANSGSFNFSSGSLTSDSNYVAFLASIGAGDSIDYSVISTTKVGTTGSALFTTSQGSVAKVTGQKVGNAVNAGVGFQQGANNAASSSPTSALLDSTNSWVNLSGAATPESVFGTNLFGSGATSGSQGAIGTAMSFYYETSSALTALSNTGTTLAKLAGQWLLANDTLTYTSATSEVPLPAGLPLLLSGLAAMGLFGRRKGGALKAAA
jgi:hypothetical protein